MTWPSASFDGLKKVAAWEYVLRFVFGGLVSVAAALLSKRFGTAFGGMFLAFPAILPASLTLVKRHDGRRSAVDDARGGRVGTFALAAFGGVIAMTAQTWSPFVFLPVALVAWLGVAVLAWGIALANRS